MWGERESSMVNGEWEFEYGQRILIAIGFQTHTSASLSVV